MDEVRDALAEPPESAGDDVEPVEPPRPAPPVPDLGLPEPLVPTESPRLGDAPVTPEPPPVQPETVRKTPPDDDEPLWKRLAREQGAPPLPATPATTAAPTPSDDEPLWKRFANSDLAARLPDPPAPPRSLADEIVADEPNPDDGPDSTVTPSAGLQPDSPELDALERRVLGDTDRERRSWYLSKLFGGSPSAYHSTLTQIDQATTYTDATAIFSTEVLQRYQVSPFTDVAAAFIDDVQAQYERGA